MSGWEDDLEVHDSLLDNKEHSNPNFHKSRPGGDQRDHQTFRTDKGTLHYYKDGTRKVFEDDGDW